MAHHRFGQALQERSRLLLRARTCAFVWRNGKKSPSTRNLRGGAAALVIIALTLGHAAGRQSYRSKLVAARRQFRSASNLSHARVLAQKRTALVHPLRVAVPKRNGSRVQMASLSKSPTPTLVPKLGTDHRHPFGLERIQMTVAVEILAPTLEPKFLRNVSTP